MSSIIATILYLGGLAMFWLYFRISNDQSSAPDEHQGHVLADEYGEVLSDEEPETHGQRYTEEDLMALDCWDHGKEPV